jgi:hypothetical protein
MFPTFIYLGLPVSTARPKVEHFEVPVHTVARRLIFIVIFLTQAGKLELVKFELSSLPTYYMTTLKISISMLKQIDKYIRHDL